MKCIREFKDARRELLEVFPNLAITVEDVVEQNDKVVVRWSVQATHRGPGFGVPATNRRVSFRGMTWLELRDGRIARGWDSWNLGGLILTLNQPEAAAPASGSLGGLFELGGQRFNNGIVFADGVAGIDLRNA